MVGRNSSLIREKFHAIVTAQAKFSLSSSYHSNDEKDNDNNGDSRGEEGDFDESKDFEPLLQGRGRSNPILIRGGRSWYIEIDTCYGHCDPQEGFRIVQGIARPEEVEPPPPEETKINGKALLRASVTKIKMLNALNPQRYRSSSAASTQKVKVSFATLMMEEDEDPDPDLDLPIFSVLLHDPDPRVESEQDGITEPTQPQTIRTHKRGSMFNGTSTTDSSSVPTTTKGSSITSNTERDTATTIKTSSSQDDDDDDEEDEGELLEGFGRRSKPKPSVRRFVKKNRFLNKVFTRRGKDDANPILIDDDYFDR